MTNKNQDAPVSADKTYTVGYANHAIRNSIALIRKNAEELKNEIDKESRQRETIIYTLSNNQEKITRLQQELNRLDILVEQLTNLFNKE